MSQFKLDDGTELPEPLSRVVHTHESRSRSDNNIRCTVVEVQQRTTVGAVMRGRNPVILTLSASANDAKWDYVAQDFLVAIAAQRAIEGWEIVSISHRAAYLKRV